MKATIISVIIAVVLIGGVAMLSGKSPGAQNQSLQSSAAADNVSTSQGTQVIAIAVKGGYSPRTTAAKAGVPTTLELQTNGTFDCSSAITIAAVGYRANLPPSGTTEVEIPPQPTGSSIRGVCAMGMYSFEVDFD
jgi:plastocyanin domain-containing protein